MIGVIFFVAEKTFEWGSFKLLGKIPRSDMFIIVAVSVVTVLTDLAIAVILGLIIAALVFAWEHAKRINVTTYIDVQGWKIYELEGTLFFASSAQFQNLFSPENDTTDVVMVEVNEFEDPHYHIAVDKLS